MVAFLDTFTFSLEFTFGLPRLKFFCNMKNLILLALVSVCRAAPAVVVASLTSPDQFGASVQYKNQDSSGNYNFGYNEEHPSGGTYRRENGDGFGNVAGSYGLRDADGRYRIVRYVADANGFRAQVDSNEPGVEPQDPASATFNKPAIVAGPPPPPPVAVPALPLPPPPPAPFAPVKFLPPRPPPPVKALPPAPVQFLPPPPPPPPPAPLSFPVAGVAPPGLPYPPYQEAILPYPNPYLPLNGPPVAEYFGGPYLNRIAPGPPALPNFSPVQQAGFANFPYGLLNRKSLPSFQPLGYS